jgi:small conductance mechanosensitive channel
MRWRTGASLQPPEEHMEFDLQPLMETGLAIGIKIVGAIFLWIVGRVAIKIILGFVDRSTTKAKVDATLARYLRSASDILFNVILIIAILSVFGVETTTFAALLAAAGVAIGMAWSGLLANFAAGAFMVILRPFKAGDFVEIGGILGTVHEIGLFVTTIDTMDNVRTILGNNAVFSGTIRNFSHNPHRRVDLVAQLAHSVDPAAAVALLQERLAAIPNVVADPAPVVEILEFNLAGPVLAVRPFVNNEHYWQVYFDTNRVIRESFGEAGFPVPEKHIHVAGRAS